MHYNHAIKKCYSHNILFYDCLVNLYLSWASVCVLPIFRQIIPPAAPYTPADIPLPWEKQYPVQSAPIKLDPAPVFKPSKFIPRASSDGQLDELPVDKPVTSGFRPVNFTPPPVVSKPSLSKPPVCPPLDPVLPHRFEIPKLKSAKRPYDRCSKISSIFMRMALLFTIINHHLSKLKQWSITINVFLLAKPPLRILSLNSGGWYHWDGLLVEWHQVWTCCLYPIVIILACVSYADYSFNKWNLISCLLQFYDGESWIHSS